MGIGADQGFGGAENGGTTAIVGQQLVALGLELVDKTMKPDWISTSKAIDGLVWIADGKDGCTFSQCGHQLVLGLVDILKLIDEELPGSSAHRCRHRTVFLQHGQQAWHQGIEIDQFLTLQTTEIGHKACIIWHHTAAAVEGQCLDQLRPLCLSPIRKAFLHQQQPLFRANHPQTGLLAAQVQQAIAVEGGHGDSLASVQNRLQPLPYF